MTAGLVSPGCTGARYTDIPPNTSTKGHWHLPSAGMKLRQLALATCRGNATVFNARVHIPRQTGKPNGSSSSSTVARPQKQILPTHGGGPALSRLQNRILQCLESTEPNTSGETRRVFEQDLRTSIPQPDNQANYERTFLSRTRSSLNPSAHQRRTGQRETHVRVVDTLQCELLRSTTRRRQTCEGLLTSP